MAKKEKQEKVELQENSTTSPVPDVNPNNEQTNESDDEIEVPIKDQQVKQKRPQTEKQKEATRYMRERLKQANDERKQKKTMEEQQKKAEIEKKIVDKAKKIRVKQLKKEAILNEISDDDSLSDKSVKSLKVILQEKKRAQTPVKPQQTPVVIVNNTPAQKQIKPPPRYIFL